MREHEKTRRELNSITSRIIGAAIALHEVFGPGLLESVYSTCLARDLIEAGLDVATGYPIGLNYKDVHIACAFRADIVVNRCVLVELKAVEQVAPVHLRQLTTYLKLADYRVGLLLNFGAALLRDGGIHRRVNRFPD
jgi:iron complex transport system substrate-binding protein